MARTQFFATVLWVALIRVYLKPLRKVDLKMIVFGLMMLVALVAYFGIVAQTLEKTVQSAGIVTYMPRQLTFLADSYLYLTGTIPAFQAYVSDVRNIGEYTLGANSILPIVKIVRILFFTF